MVPSWANDVQVTFVIYIRDGCHVKSLDLSFIIMNKNTSLVVIKAGHIVAFTGSGLHLHATTITIF